MPRGALAFGAFSSVASKNVKTVSFAKLVLAGKTPEEVKEYERRVCIGDGFRMDAPIHREDMIFSVKFSQRRAGK